MDKREKYVGVMVVSIVLTANLNTLPLLYKYERYQLEFYPAINNSFYHILKSIYLKPLAAAFGNCCEGFFSISPFFVFLFANPYCPNIFCKRQIGNHTAKLSAKNKVLTGKKLCAILLSE